MNPDEVAEIFAEKNVSHGEVSSKPTYADIDKFDETVNALLVELIR